MNIELLNGEVVDLGPRPTDADVEHAHVERGLGAAFAKNAEVAEAYRKARAEPFKDAAGTMRLRTEAEALEAVADLKAEVALLVANAGKGDPS